MFEDDLDIVIEEDSPIDEHTSSFGSKVKSVASYFYDSKTGKILNRRPLHLLATIIFYVVFYFIICAVCAGCYLAFWFANFSITIPRYHNEAGLQRNKDLPYISQSNPAVGFRPGPHHRTTLIHFRSGAPETYDIYRNDIEAFLSRYLEDKRPDNTILHECSVTNPPTEDIGCTFKPETKLSACGNVKNSDFGYNEGQPCFYLKINKIYGWIPKPFDCSDLSNSDCLHLIKAEANYRGDVMVLRELFELNYNETFSKPLSLGQLFNGDNIPFTCTGFNPTDREELKDIKWQGDPIKKWYFPYLNQIGYLSPIAAVKLNVTTGVIIMMKCQAWAENIINNNEYYRDGSYNFELMME